jgi:hypothetical protein
LQANSGVTTGLFAIDSGLGIADARDGSPQSPPETDFILNTIAALCLTPIAIGVVELLSWDRVFAADVAALPTKHADGAGEIAKLSHVFIA